MKKEIKFNHDAKSRFDAVGGIFNKEEMAILLTQITVDFTKHDELKFSRLAERIHNNLPYEMMLMMVAMNVMQTIVDSSLDIKFNSIINELRQAQNN